MTSGSAAIPAASLHGSRLCRNGSLCAAGFHRVGHLPHGAISPLAKVETIEKDKTKTVQKKMELCTLRIDPQPAWTAKEKKALATLTLIVAVVSFAYLGSMKAPQNPVDATDSTATIDFTPQQDAVEIWVYPGISTAAACASRMQRAMSCTGRN